jgi:hypothetical protein
MQDAQQKVAPRGVTLILQPHRLEFKLEASLCERLAVILLDPLSTAPTAQLGWPEITFGDPQGTSRSSYCLL